MIFSIPNKQLILNIHRATTVCQKSFSQKPKGSLRHMRDPSLCSVMTFLVLVRQRFMCTPITMEVNHEME